MQKIFILIAFLSLTFNVFSQNKYTISGYVKVGKTGEELIGASIVVKELSGIGAHTNSYGFFSLTIPEGNYTITAQFIGYDPINTQVNLTKNQKLNFTLSEKNTELKEVIVSDLKKNDNITKPLMGVEKVNIKEIQNIPVLLGERDVLKTIQLLPGIKSAGEGNSGFYVRGGGADQNLILLDEALVYNASHLMGFFSVFNSDAIKDVTIYKGEMPAQYGGRLSSTLDIKMNDGNNKKFGVSGGIGLIASRLNVEGPLIKDKSSFFISARRTYADMFLKLSKDSTLKNTSLYFYDLNAKVNYRINDKNRIFLSGYFGRDNFNFGTTFGFNWGNATGTLRWNHVFNDKLFTNTSFIFTNYNYVINIGSGITQLNVTSKIVDYNLKRDFEYFHNARSKIKFGFNTTYHTITPGSITQGDTAVSELDKKHAWENAAYISHEFSISDKINIEYGLRFVSFSLLGSGNFYSYNSYGEIADSVHYNSGQFVKTYYNPEPRFSASYIINKKTSVKAAFARNTQNLHLLSNSTSMTPTDLWIPSSNNVQPEISNQVSFGYFRNFDENNYEFSAEVYYKNLENQIDYKNGTQLRANNFVEADLLYGSGRAYGIELFLKKKYGKFNGWIGYSLSRTERTFAAIDKGNYFPAKQDRTHDISVVGMYEFSKKWTFSATWVYYTGNAVTFPSGKYIINGQVVNYYTEKNGYRMPAYHRLDVGATWQRKKTEKFESSWTFSIYNVYARENAYSISFKQDPNDPSKTQAEQLSLFRIIPSFTYNFKF